MFKGFSTGQCYLGVLSKLSPPSVNCVFNDEFSTTFGKYIPIAEVRSMEAEVCTPLGKSG